MKSFYVLRRHEKQLTRRSKRNSEESMKRHQNFDSNNKCLVQHCKTPGLDSRHGVSTIEIPKEDILDRRNILVYLGLQITSVTQMTVGIWVHMCQSLLDGARTGKYFATRMHQATVTRIAYFIPKYSKNEHSNACLCEKQPFCTYGAQKRLNLC